MKILYGIQGTGNGHLTRSRLIAKEFNNLGLSVDYFFSGREKSQYFDMEVFGDLCTFSEGLSFQQANGGVDWLKTIQKAEVAKLYHRAKELPVEQYDLVLTDYEPTVAWAAKLKGVQSVGIGHQYAFKYKSIPKAGNFLTQLGMDNFAPVAVNIGLHWHHFNEPILPPIIEQLEPTSTNRNKVVVYLPAEEARHMVALFSAFKDFHFEYFTNQEVFYKPNNVKINAISKAHFLAELKSCQFIICNAGFELASEALQLGKSLLVKPMKGQVEQQANALAMHELGYGWTCGDKLTPDIVFQFLQSMAGTNAKLTVKRIKFPDVAKALVTELVKDGADLNVERLSKNLWMQVE
jgi:uncharacterized protein (TIGR00661 family)